MPLNQETKPNQTKSIYIHSWPKYLPEHSTQVGYDTRSIFVQGLIGLNSELSFS